MGILSNRLISMEPWLHDSTDHDETSDIKNGPDGSPYGTVAIAFLDWRWAMPTSHPIAPLPANTAEQPLLDALHPSQSWDADDGSFSIELDGFLIDRQTAAAASGDLSTPIAA